MLLDGTSPRRKVKTPGLQTKDEKDIEGDILTMSANNYEHTFVKALPEVEIIVPEIE